MPTHALSTVYLVLVTLQVLLGRGLAYSSEPFKISQIADDTGTLHYFPILQEAYRRLGFEIVAVPLPAERALRVADSGLTDGETVRIEGLEALYPNLVRVPESVVSVKVKAFTTGTTFPVAGWESLRPYSICYMHGLKLYEQGTQGMNRVSALGLENALRLLRDGICDVAVLSPSAWIMVDSLKMGPMRELEPPIATYDLYHYVHRRHEKLVPLLAEELRKMKQEGVVQAILEPYRQAVDDAKVRQSLP
ncbi:type 2 periplasmic-binding domain-containing protein [Fundidesulfovibrio putealis]|uniref:hypothetical protein n=1 Tax=Fundidesulfovibrio putealis TaxID=270496 RepID=UPI000485A702|nr:hypothetical protein [Fundidesulfovibrio putealis]